VRSRETEALTPASEAEAIEQFGGGSNVTVLAGGTILMPEVTYGRYPKGGRTLMLHRAGLDAVADNGAVTFGAIGGNLCGSPGVEAPLDPHDDALASAWYRREVLPVLVARAIEQLQGG
jgi:CO/xanthine dehydrogenase FAD-binding subunit